MICYQDRSFCAAGDACHTAPCTRRLSMSDSVRAATIGIPVAFMDFSHTCESFFSEEEYLKKKAEMFAVSEPRL